MEESCIFKFFAHLRRNGMKRITFFGNCLYNVLKSLRELIAKHDKMNKPKR